MSALSSQSHYQMLGFDCVVIVDCHLSLSAERRLYALLDAHRDNAVGTGVIALHQDWHAPSWIRSGQAQKRLRDGQFAWLDPNVPCRATLVLLLSPSLAGFGRNRALRLTADRVVVWPIEAEFAPIGDQLSSLHDQVGRLKTILDAPIAWAARSEAEQRFLAERLTGGTLEPEIWWPLIRGEVAPPKPQGQWPWTVGRHWGQKASLNDVGLAEWQDAWREAWPVAIALLGDLELLRGLPPSAPDQLVRHHDPRLLKLKDFLDSLDLFVAIGGTPGALRLPEEILEAMGAGLVVIGSSMTSAGFENVLPSTEACFLGDLASRLLSDNLALETSRREQQRYFERRHSARAYQRRLRQVFCTHNAEPPLIWSGRTKRPGRVLFISDDSRYLEHLPRQLAIAKNLQAPLEPYFLTMARDAGLAERLGFPSEFLLPHTSQTYRALFDRSEAWNQSLDGTYRTLLDRAETWNQDLARHLRELIPFLDAKAVVFDGIFPFAGLVEVCTQYPTLPFAWVRRGLWQVDADEGGLVRSGLFDLVIEPGDLAETFDRGPTRLHREHVIATAPIRLGKLEAPARARFELGIDADQTSVFLHPTIPGDHRTGDALAELLRGLANGGCRFWTTNLIPDGPQQSWPVEVTRLDSLAAGRRLAGFDIAIGGADYRSAHDNAASGLPSVFMADSGKPTDDQATRAATAARDGWAILLARGDVYGARAAARRLLDPGEREVMRGRCEKDEGRALNGAKQAALAISQMVYALDLTPPSAWRNGAS